MLKYSYNVLLKENEATLMALQISLLKTNNEKFKELIEKKEKEIEWIKKRLEEEPELSKPRIQ